MCDVDESFVRDKFNLTGLDELVPDFERALRIVLDECRDGSGKTADSAEASAKLLYGLVHARFVMTPRGVAKMIDKYAAGCFGRCPRVNCERSPVLPIGTYNNNISIRANVKHMLRHNMHIAPPGPIAVDM